MKNLSAASLVTGLFFLLGMGSARAQISFRIGYEQTTQTYEVYMTSTQSFTGNSARMATAQVTVLLPHGTGANRFVVTNVQGKPVQRGTQIIQLAWDISSRADAPSEDISTDFQSFGFTNLSGLQFTIQAGQEIGLFSFQNSNPCTGSVRIINNTEPFAANIPNSAGTTAGNALYIQGAGNKNAYMKNYGTAANCGLQPDLSTAISGPTAISAGSSANYSIALTNIGNTATTGNLTLAITVAAGLTYTGFTGTGWSVSSTIINGMTVLSATSSAVVQASGGTTTPLVLTLTALITAGSTTATITGGVNTPGDSNTSNNSFGQPITILAGTDCGSRSVCVPFSVTRMHSGL